jgi:hypothetical protein
VIEKVIDNNKNVQQPLPVPGAVEKAHNKQTVAVPLKKG